jgi:hypothetical protein
MQYLKQSTSATIKLGPFLDDTDGKTAETGLTITQADVRLTKNGGNFAQKNDASAASHDEFGWYDVDLDATDTGTLGRLILAVHESGALPVWREFMVIPANEYDSLISGSDTLDVNVAEISEDSAAADNLETAFDGGTYDVGGIDVSELNTAVDAIGSDGTGLTEAGGDGDHLTEAGGDGDHLTEAGGTGDQFTGLPEVDADVVKISGDTNAANNAESFFDGTGYAGTNNVIPSVTTVTGNVDGSVGSVTGAVGSVTGAVGSVTGAVGSVTGNVGGNVVGSVASVAGNVGGNVTGSVASVVGAVGSVTGAVGSVTGDVGGDVTGSVASVTGDVGGNVTGSVGSVVGHTPQTGDSFTRLGAPAGVSVSADIADVPTVAEMNARTLVAADYFDPSTDTVDLSLAVKQAIADEMLKRGASNAEATAEAGSLTELLLAAFESDIVGAAWTIYKSNHVDVFNTRTVTSDASAEPIVGVT